jgi:hypothetical protein
MMRIAAAIGILVWLMPSSILAEEGAGWCARRIQLAGPCTTVHGRLQFTNGTPGLRVWVVGTKRVLGLAGEEGAELLPDQLRALLADGVALYGDFAICPVTRSDPGVMQTICIQAGRRLVRSEERAGRRMVTRPPDVVASP